MSLEIHLEADERLTSIDARLILSDCGVTILGRGDSESQSLDLEGLFPESDMPVWFAPDSEPEEVMAEVAVRPSWKRSSEMVFQLMKSELELCNTQIMALAEALAKKNPAYFVLSYEYETVLAINDSDGYREISDPV
jgi:hypothetical protein